MALTLYYHPLASFCWKPLVALYENATSFTPHLVDLGDEESRHAFLKVWPMGEFPVLRDGERNRTIPQSAAIIEYLDLHFRGVTRFIPDDPESALGAHQWDSFFDSYVHVPMQKIVGDTLRSSGEKDPAGVKEARETLLIAYGILENLMSAKTWAAGEAFTMADCSAAPALFYGDKVEPFGKTHPCLARYLDRLKRRPSFARVLVEAEPYFHMFPYKG